MSHNDLPAVSTRHESGGDKETPREKSTLSNSQDPKQITPSHPKLVSALSKAPYSPLFGILWPIIIEQATFDTRDVLRKVDPYFQKLCHPYENSDLAKRRYVSCEGIRKGPPIVLDLSFGVEWRLWGANKCGFNSVSAFHTFCALGDIDPYQGRSWDSAPRLVTYIWMSRTKDVVFETMQNPLTNHGYCHYFGLTGVADKAIAMYNFMHDNRSSKVCNPAVDPAMTTIWAEMGWDRFIL